MPGPLPNQAGIRQQQDSATLLLPSPAGNLVSFTLPNVGFAVLDLQVPQTVNEEYWLLPLLAQAYQAWQATAGWNNNQTLIDNVPIAGSGELNALGGEIRRLYLDFGNVFLQGKLHGNNPVASLYATGQFLYGAAAGPMRYISFQHSFLEPEGRGATGFRYQIYGANTALATMYASDLLMPGITWGTAGLSDPETGDPFAGGIPAEMIPEVYNGVSTTAIQAHLDGSQQVTNATVHSNILLHNFGFLYNIGGLQQLLQKLVSEIWEMTAERRRGQTNDGAVTCPMNGSISASQRFIKSAVVDLAQSVSNPDYVFGNTGAAYLGCWAPRVGTAFGELRYLNSFHNYLCNLPRDCTAIWFALKPHVTGTVTFATSPTVVTTASHGGNPINLVAGELTGIPVL